MTKRKHTLFGNAPTPSESLIRLLGRKNLGERESFQLFHAIFSGKLTSASTKAFLLLLAEKGETFEEIAGCLVALRRLEPSKRTGILNLLDTCGTGGDKSHSINVSTLAAIVIAGAGGKIAKHGNRSISSRCGSSDLMEALGVSLDANQKTMIAAIQKCGLGYFHAPAHHPVFSKLQGLRKSLKRRTVLNLLGPLVNPLALDAQLVGVPKSGQQMLYAKLLQRTGVRRGLVCHSRDGMDEISLNAATDIVWIDGKKLRPATLRPSDYGLKSAHVGIQGGNLKKNARHALAILSGKLKGPARDLILLNAAAGLVLCRKARTIQEGIRLAADSIDSGKASRVLQTLAKISRPQISGPGQKNCNRSGSPQFVIPDWTARRLPDPESSAQNPGSRVKPGMTQLANVPTEFRKAP